MFLCRRRPSRIGVHAGRSRWWFRPAKRITCNRAKWSNRSMRAAFDSLRAKFGASCVRPPTSPRLKTMAQSYRGRLEKIIIILIKTTHSKLFVRSASLLKGCLLRGSLANRASGFPGRLNNQLAPSASAKRTTSLAAAHQYEPLKTGDFADAKQAAR